MPLSAKHTLNKHCNTLSANYKFIAIEKLIDGSIDRAYIFGRFWKFYRHICDTLLHRDNLIISDRHGVNYSRALEHQLKSKLRRQFVPTQTLHEM
jgi:hypothetical protein